MTAEQRLLLLDTWLRSGLPAADFAALVGLSKHTLYDWKRKFQAEGPAGLVDRPRGSPPGSRLPEVTRRAILMLDAKQSFAKTRSQTGVWERGATVFGNDVNEVQLPLVPKLPFGNARLRNSVSLAFTFVLKRQNRRVYLVGFLDDHSRFLVSYGLHASQSSALVLEVLRAGLANYGPPEEILTDNGSQYVTWRGKSAFSNQNETEFQREGLRENLSFPNSCLGTSLPETLFRFRLVDSVTE
jgi:hypothetical protein